MLTFRLFFLQISVTVEPSDKVRMLIDLSLQLLTVCAPNV